MDLPASLGRSFPRLVRSHAPADLVSYSRDLWPRHHIGVREGRLPAHRPGVIVWPESADDVAQIVRFCAGEGVPLVPFGAGSGVCGGILPDARTVVIDMKRMAKVRSIDRDRPWIDVEAGALGIRLEEDLQDQGFTIGHFPSSILCSTVGGWIAARGAGQCSGRYGKIEDMVAALEVVTGTGDVVRFTRRTNGPDLSPIVIGSEGVLGVVTSATLRLHAVPVERAFGALSFPTIEAGWDAMRWMFQAGLRPAVARLYDPFDSYMAKRGAAKRGEHKKEHKTKGPGTGAAALRMILRAPGALNTLLDKIGDRAFGGAMLVLVFEGAKGEASADLAHAISLGSHTGGTALGEGPARHWYEHRYSVSYRQAPMFMSGAFVDTMEVAAPWSKLGALYENVRRAMGRSAFVMAHLSHAYPDGCSIYFTFAGGGSDASDQERRYDATWRDALAAAIEAGGTLSHHHGVGRSKAPALGAELGLGVDVIRSIRDTFDPAGVMNPGNLLPRSRSAPRAPAPPAITDLHLDRASLLAHAPGSFTVLQIEEAVGRDGLTLGLDPRVIAEVAPMSLDAWIAAGAPGSPDPWADPVDHVVAGFSAELGAGASDSGRVLAVPPSPRRAVGPDLFALFLGTQGKTGRIRSAWLRVSARAGARTLPRSLPFTGERNAPIDAAEGAWIAAACRAAATTADPGSIASPPSVPAPKVPL